MALNSTAERCSEHVKTGAQCRPLATWLTLLPLSQVQPSLSGICFLYQHSAYLWQGLSEWQLF